jgi:aldehyde dehydrogenase (NAD+)
MTTFPNLIDGQRIESADRNADINPSNTGDVIGDFARGSRQTLTLRLPRRGRRFQGGRDRRRRSDSTSSTAPAPKSWRARMSSDVSFRASKASRWPMASAKPARAGMIFKFFAGEACVSRVTRWNRRGQA